MTCLIGIDSGLTVTKAVVFDTDGTMLAVARRRVPQIIPGARLVERDMAGFWRATATAVSEAIHACGRPAGEIAAVGVTGHGDGLYLLDRHKQPLGTAILSLDSRAGEVAEALCAGAGGAHALALTGQMPHASAPSALLAWMKLHQPDRFAGIAHLFSCKDWLRFCLTGTIGTDRTEASTSFTNVATQGYDPQALAIFGLSALAHALPPIAGSAEVVGAVTPEASRLTGLPAGTPVVAGLQDVTASAMGIGGQREGTVDVVAGTYSINQIVTRALRVDARWLCRNAVAPGHWNAMSISPASTANYDWFVDNFCADLPREGLHQHLAGEVGAVMARPSTLLFHPYLYGSPHGPQASGGFLGLRGWHGRADMLRAVLEGIAFNHRDHLAALRDGFAFDAVRLTGGASRNPGFVQMFADILGLPVTVTATEEAASWGAALCAGAGVGIYASPFADPRDLSALARTYPPEPGQSASYQRRYDLWRLLAETLKPHWPAIETLGTDLP